MRHSILKIWSATIAVLILTLLLMLFFSLPGKSDIKHNQQTEIADRFLLTDLCLSTESRHTRHISQPELMAAFQDIPGFYDHFPSSSFFRPPQNGRIFSVNPSHEDN